MLKVYVICVYILTPIYIFIWLNGIEHAGGGGMTEVFLLANASVSSLLQDILI